jgi:hypothetical protein
VTSSISTFAPARVARRKREISITATSSGGLAAAIHGFWAMGID